MPDPVHTDPARTKSARTETSSVRFARLFDAKLTPTVAVLFFVALAAMCAAAAGIGYVTRSLQHVEVRR